MPTQGLMGPDAASTRRGRNCFSVPYCPLRGGVPVTKLSGHADEFATVCTTATVLVERRRCRSDRRIARAPGWSLCQWASSPSHGRRRCVRFSEPEVRLNIESPQAKCQPWDVTVSLSLLIRLPASAGGPCFFGLSSRNFRFKFQSGHASVAWCSRVPSS